MSTAHRDHCVASGVLCRSHHPEPDFTPDRRHAARFHLHGRLVKGNGFGRTRTPSIDECCLLRFGLRRACSELGLRLTHCEGTESRTTSHRAVMSPPRNRPPAPFHHPSTKLDGQTQADSWASLRLAANGTPGPDAARRILQPEQSTSTTLGPLDPRRARSA